jgi:hypothetical protein
MTASSQDKNSPFCPFFKSEDAIKQCRWGPEECAKAEECAQLYRLLTKEELEKHLRNLDAPVSPWKNTSLLVQDDAGTSQFKAQASLGPEISPCGFAYFDGDEWICCETTFFYGMLKQKLEQDKPQNEAESLKAVVIYVQNGHRNLKLLDGAVFNVAGKALRPKASTLAVVGINTLMDLDAAQRFLAGEEVEPNHWYNQICTGLRAFSNLSFDCRLYDVISCIVMASYFYDILEVFPILIIFGPFETGKGRLLHCVIYMGHRGMSGLDPSDASLYRMTEAWKPYIGIDEFYDFTRNIERLLRSMYKRGTKVPRMEKTKGGQFYLTLFETFSKSPLPAIRDPPGIFCKKASQLQ